MVFLKFCYIFALFCVISTSCKSASNIRADHPYGNLKPILECVLPSPTSGYVNAYFGFLNNELDTIEIPVGKDNRMSPPPQDRSQTEVFFNRRSRHFPMSAFYAPFASTGQLTWELNGYQVTASADDNTCRTAWMAFEVVILQDRAPTQSIIDQMTLVTQEIVGAEDDQIIGVKLQSTPTFHQIVMNITTVEGAVSPMAAMIYLFGNTAVYDDYVLQLRGLGLVIVSVDTMETGLEKMAEAGSPAPRPTPTAGTSPITPPPLSTPTIPTVEPPQDNSPTVSPIDNTHGPNAPSNTNPFTQPSFGSPIFTGPVSSAMSTHVSVALLAVLILFQFILI